MQRLHRCAGPGLREGAVAKENGQSDHLLTVSAPAPRKPAAPPSAAASLAACLRGCLERFLYFGLRTLARSAVVLQASRPVVSNRLYCRRFPRRLPAKAGRGSDLSSNCGGSMRGALRRLLPCMLGLPACFVIAMCTGWNPMLPRALRHARCRAHGCACELARRAGRSLLPAPATHGTRPQARMARSRRERGRCSPRTEPYDCAGAPQLAQPPRSLPRRRPLMHTA